MSTSEMLAELVARTGASTTAEQQTCSYLLEDAMDAILLKMYPLQLPDDTTFPTRYSKLAIRLAYRYWQRRGQEGETSHSDNGVSSGYSSPNDEDLLHEVKQVVVL